ncbi:5'/3'-nucleotidase SurE [Oceanobacillus sp. M65]|uniref:5'/3'-nucleotidase SurE n=1 Tax=Oceanobacillus sp. M65 TaxID=3457435 RepID=UPI003FCECB14
MKKNRFFVPLVMIVLFSFLVIGCSEETKGESDGEETSKESKSEVRADEKENNLVDSGVPVSERDRPMRVLLINDDGFDSIGIQLLHERLKENGYDVWTVAPINNQSGTGTSIKWDEEEHELIEHGNQQYAFEGTPTDSFKVAVNVIMDEKPDLVISGVNDGPNYGEIQFNSGTVGGAARAVRHGYPAIAASLNFFGGEELDKYMDPAVDYVVNMVDVLNEEWQSGNMIMPLGTGLSINYPAEESSEIKGVKFIENEEVYSDFQNYKYDEEKKGIYNFNDMGYLTSLIEDEEIETDLTIANRGFVTVTVIDGNWNAEEQKVDYMKSVLSELEAY